jgi:hypothetical protein
MTARDRLRLGYHRTRGAWRQTLAARHERQDRREFAAFYRGLPRREDIIYMFFTSDLLQWVHRAVSFVPAEANLVLVGSGLAAEEVAWVRARYRWPFHPIRSRVDDNTALGFAFEVAEHNFGWLHVDCFVLNPRLFAEMAALADGVVANCIWSHPGENGLGALHSAFVFLNFAAIRDLRARGIEVSPYSYHYEGGPAGRTASHRPLYSRVPTRRHVELLRRVLPAGESGLPRYPQGGSYFQILVLFQLVANALGYRLHHVRELVRDGSGGASSFSNDIVHVNGVATYRATRETDPTIGGRFYPLLVQADYVMLSTMGDEPPPRYRQLLAEAAAELERLQIPPAGVMRNLGAFLASRGIAADRVAMILGRGPGR